MHGYGRNGGVEIGERWTNIPVNPLAPPRLSLTEVWPVRLKWLQFERSDLEDATSASHRGAINWKAAPANET